MKKMKCRLNISSLKSEGHTSQIVSGFMILKQQGIIDLEIHRTPDHPFVGIVEVIINNKTRVLYDMADGYVFDAPKVKEYANKADFYFKRSFSAGDNTRYDFASRIYPLGLNYHVTTKDNILDKPQEEGLLRKGKWLLKEIQGKNYHQNFYVESFEDTPKYCSKDPLILFTTRTWSGEGNSLDNDETKYIDETRAQIIRKLRNEFGDRFVGGFTPREYALKNFSDCILDESVTNRINFMALVKKSDICISTMGLWGSNGWKLGEYVAASKAIVSEKLRYAVTGDFDANKNYLEFTTAEQCVEQTIRLANDKGLMYQMKKNNYDYYNNYLKPDQLVLNSLRVVTENKLISKIS